MMYRLLKTVLLVLVASASQAKGVDAERQAITIAIGNEPPTLNSAEVADATSNFILGHLMDGLTRFGRRGRVEAALAERWEMVGNQYTFHLREAVWSDGRSVTAHDFVFAWRLAVSPEAASPFSTNFYVIKNAREILAGEKPSDSLGVVAADDRTLVVTLTHPVMYFPQIVTGTNFYPIREDFYEAQGERYAAEPEHLLTNGAFRLAGWIHGASLKLVRNEEYWNADGVGLQQINIGYITPDTSTVLNLFRDGQVAFATLDNVTVRTAAESGLRVRSFSPGSTQLMIINTSEGRATANVSLRRALASVLDKNRIVNNVLALPGSEVSHSVFPAWNPLVAEGYDRDDPLGRPSFQPENAAALMARVKEELGTVPTLTLLTVTNPTLTKLSEYMQGVFKRELDIDVKIDSQNMKQWLAKAFQADFDVTVISYGPLIGDPADPGALYTSDSESNLGRFKNPEYDLLFERFRTSLDVTDRLYALRQMQNIMEDQIPVVPLYENSGVYVQDQRLRGVLRERLGLSPNFIYARITQ